MTYPALRNSNREVLTDSGLLAATEEPPAMLANDDKHASTHEENGMVPDGASIDRLTSDVAGIHISNGAATESTTSKNPSPCTEKFPVEAQLSTLGTNVETPQAPNDISNSALSKREEVTPNQAMPASSSVTRHINHAEGKKSDLKSTSTAVTSTEPVGIYYPPRRPNIFRARAKHLRFPECDQNPVASDAVSKSEGAMEDDDDDSSFEGLEEFESEAKQTMEKKTKQFMSVVQQCAWMSRVEDLGTVQEIEE